MKRTPVNLDLATARAELKVWRATRKGKERIPEKYWDAAIALLEHYPFQKVRKELNLNTKQLKQRAEAKGIKTTQRQYKERNAVPHSRSNNQTFLKVSAGELINSPPSANTAQLPKASEQACRIVFERADGSRLSLNLPVELNLIQSICQSFLKG
jgi:hypothetical protein